MNTIKKWINSWGTMEKPLKDLKKKKGRKNPAFHLIYQRLILLPVGTKNC